MMTKLTAADGHTFDAWIEPAQGARRGGIVIVQEIFGVTDQLKGVARHYAARGFEVAIPALFDRASRDTVVPFSEALRGRELMQSIDPDAMLSDIAATCAALRAHGGKVAVLGFCWGGGLALQAAQRLPIDGAVAFYGTRITTMLSDDLKAPLQFHAGATDDHTPPEVCAQLVARYPEVELYTYEGAGHAFANDARPSYVAEAAETAHARTAEFLTRVLGQAPA